MARFYEVYKNSKDVLDSTRNQVDEANKVLTGIDLLTDKLLEQTREMEAAVEKTSKECQVIAETTKTHTKIIEKFEGYKGEIFEFYEHIKLQPLSDRKSEKIRIGLQEINEKFELLKVFEMLTYAELYTGKGIILYSMGDYSDALEAFETTISLKVDHARNWYRKGATLEKLGRPKEALQAYEEAMKFDKNDADAYVYGGLIFARNNQFGEAIAAVENALKLEHNDPDLLYTMAVTFIIIGDKSRALECFRKAIELDSMYKDITKRDENLKTLWNDKNFKKLTE